MERYLSNCREHKKPTPNNNERTTRAPKKHNMSVGHNGKKALLLTSPILLLCHNYPKNVCKLLARPLFLQCIYVCWRLWRYTVEHSRPMSSFLVSRLHLSPFARLTIQPYRYALTEYSTPSTSPHFAST